jgi:hypothetical protein
MGIAELAASLLADPGEDQHQPPMDEVEVRSQLYGESIAARNVLSAGTPGDGGRGRDDSSRSTRELRGRPSPSGAGPTTAGWFTAGGARRSPSDPE